MIAEDVLARLAETGTPPDGVAVARISAGLDDALGRIVDETLPFIAAGGSDLQFILAPYGRGKTHFLRAVEHCARERGFVTAYVDGQDTSSSPFLSLRDTYRAIADRMHPPGLSGTQSFCGRFGVTRVIESRLAAALAGEDGMHALAPGYRNLVRSWRACLGGDGDEALSDDLEALLAGHPVPVGPIYRRHSWLPRPLGKLGPRNAGLWLRSVLALPRVLEYPGLVVLFDETEAVLNQRRSRRRLQQHLAHIRTFVDHLASGAFCGCAVYYALVEDFIDWAEQDLKALAQRIERPLGFEQPNARAVSVRLDELTAPGPRDPRFFVELAGRIVDLGTAAGLSPDAGRRVREALIESADRFAGDLSEGTVREFVKAAASDVAQAMPTTGRGTGTA